MSNVATIKRNKPATVKSLLASESLKERFSEILGKKAPGFMSSIVNISNSSALKEAEAMSVITSAVVAATLDLPIDPNLGFAYVVPYNTNENGKWTKKAQFQMGYKGYVQLALRTGQYKNINVVEIYKGQIKSWNPLTEELEFDFEEKESNEVIGYAAFFKLTNGFEKTVYWSKEEVLAHAKQYSKTFNKGPWKDNFNGMAKKTVLKDMLKKWGILSIEMQKAITTDQAVIKENIVKKGADINSNVEYVDNPSAQEVEYQEVKDEIKENANKEQIDIEETTVEKEDEIIDVEPEPSDEEIPY
ncbi:recombinase RecT [Clostridium botulinum]|uniref:recombinase RecT n=1 Tax=Clostridium botulinum TaxID=1491 RepID=UPI0004D35211|nr:recombinase RecT [Clostridium botulinum]KEH90460.1 RecT recombinase [Clostridium botulinum C/D str. It1]